MGRETPDEFWERMRGGGGGHSAPPREPDAGADRPRAEPVVTPPSLPAWDEPPRREREHEPSHGQASSSSSDDSSVSELVKQLTEQTKTLVKQEMRLAQVELQEKGKKVGLGAGMFGAGGLVAFFGAATLIAALVLAISTALAPWLSALIVGVVLLAVAGGAALVGKKKIEQATPPMPEQAVETVKEDVQHVKERAKEGRQ